MYGRVKGRGDKKDQNVSYWSSGRVSFSTSRFAVRVLCVCIMSHFTSQEWPIAELNLLAYSHTVAGLMKSTDTLQLSTITITLVGDLNADFKSAEGVRFLNFMRDNWMFELNNDPARSTTRSNACIDAVFTRNVEHLQTMNFILYFSCHKPLLTVTAQPHSVTCDDQSVSLYSDFSGAWNINRNYIMQCTFRCMFHS